MRRYEITLNTTASIVVVVDASDADEACDMAVDYIDNKDIELGDEWDIVDVCETDPRD
jgi:hypothetical protein